MSDSVTRALDIIDLLVARPQGPRELSEHLDVHRSTVVRLLQTLEGRGYVRRSAVDGKWTIGFALISVSQQALDNIDVRDVARPHIKALGGELDHTVHLATLVGHDVIYVDKVEGPGAVKLQSRIGGKAHVHTAGVAKAIMAYAPESARAAAIEECSFQRFTSTTLTDPSALLLELDRVRARGWAIDDGEAEDYINCVAVPIFGINGAVVAGISVTALRAIAPLGVLKGYLPRIQETRDATPGSSVGRSTPP